MFEAIGIGDLHLPDADGRGGLANYIDKPEEYVMEEVERVIRWAVKKAIGIVMFYGDMSENHRMSYEGQLAFARTIKKYPKIQFIVILGNHDKVSQVSSMGHSMELIMEMNLKNLTVYTEDTEVRYGKQLVKFCPWPSKAFNKKAFNVAHIEVRGSKGDSGREMTGNDLVKSNAVVAMGHLHTPHQVRETYYSGTLYQTNFGESLPKYFHHIQWKSPDDYEINLIPFDPKYKLFNCVVESQSDADALPRDPHHLIKLVVKDGADVVIPSLSNIVITKAFKTKNDLATILTEDLMQGSELVIKTADFFKDWIKTQSVPQSLKNRARHLRKEILSGQRK